MTYLKALQMMVAYYGLWVLSLSPRHTSFAQFRFSKRSWACLGSDDPDLAKKCHLTGLQQCAPSRQVKGGSRRGTAS